MEITILIFLVLMLGFALSVMVSIIILVCRQRNKQNVNNKINVEKQEECKQILRTSNSSEKCANAGWELVSNTPTAFLINKRKSNYSDERESQHFNASLTNKRLALLNQIDGECHYGRY